MFLSLPPARDPYGEKEEERFCLLLKSKIVEHGRGGEGSGEGQPHEPLQQDMSWKELILVAPLGTLGPCSSLGDRIALWKEVGAELVEKLCSLLQSLERGLGSHRLFRLNSLKAYWYRWFPFLYLPKRCLRLC